MFRENARGVGFFAVIVPMCRFPPLQYVWHESAKEGSPRSYLSLEIIHQKDRMIQSPHGMNSIRLTCAHYKKNVPESKYTKKVANSKKYGYYTAMRAIVTFFLVGLTFFSSWSVSVVFWEDASSWNGSGSWELKVFTTEQVPGVLCTCVDRTDPTCSSINTRKYECTVDKWLTAFQILIREILRWFIYIVMLIGVLAIVLVGIFMAWWSDSEEYTKKAKWWAWNIVVWLVILFMFRYILWALAPWIFQ